MDIKYKRSILPIELMHWGIEHAIRSGRVNAIGGISVDEEITDPDSPEQCGCCEINDYDDGGEDYGVPCQYSLIAADLAFRAR
jgi:hypothetical protein